MIYLIDDNQNNQRLNNYNLTFIEDGVFDGYLTSIEKLEAGRNLSDLSHLDFLKQADCIILHATTEDYDEKKGFLSGSTTNAIKIKEYISQEGDEIPLVLFSNSMGEAVYDFENNPKYIPSIKKNLLYERLYDFLEHYKNTGNIELRILAWGKNFKSKEISKLLLKIISSIDTIDNTEILELSDLSNSLQYFRTLMERSFPKEDFNEILIKIEDEPITIYEFKKKLNQITESFIKYGKNIYSW